MRIFAKDLHDPCISAALQPYLGDAWVQHGAVPLDRPIPDDAPWLFGQEGLLHSSVFGYFQHKETGQKVYVSFLLSEALAQSVRHSLARRKKPQRTFFGAGLRRWAYLTTQHLAARQDARDWLSFFAYAVASLEAHPTAGALANAIGATWAPHEVALTARRLGCQPIPHAVAKALKEAGKDALIPF